MAEIKLPIVIDGVKTIEELANRALGVDIIRLASTNADRIRAMSDEELAGWFSERPRNCPQPYARDGFFNGRCQMGCGNCWLDWLKSPVEKEAKE